jgi:hypothetical protein
MSLSKDALITNIISLNPTGQLTLADNGTVKMNGQNSIILTPSSQSKENLEKISNNQFICVENFENEMEKNINKDFSESFKEDKFGFFVIIVFIFLLYLFWNIFISNSGKKKYLY